MTFLERWRRSRHETPPVPSGADRMKQSAQRTLGVAKVWGLRARTEIERGAKKAAPVVKRGIEKASATGQDLTAQLKDQWSARKKRGDGGE